MILIGLGTMIESVLGGIVFLVTGVFLLPVTRTEIKKRYDVSFSRWIVVGVVLVGFTVGVAVIPPLPADSGTAQADSQAQVGGAAPGTATNTDSGAATVESTPQGPPTHSMNEPFVVGTGEQRVAYQVYGASVQDSIGESFLEEEADGQFVVVEISMSGAGSESVSISSSQFTLVDDQGREYDIDSDALFAAEDSIVFEQLDPDVQKRGILIFDVPEDQTGRQLKIDPAGMFSTAEPHYVELNG